MLQARGMGITRLAVACSAAVLCLAGTAAASIVLLPPVDAPVSRGFEAPSGRFGPGHRGIDFAVAAGTQVRAAGAGTVTFAGDVAGRGAVTVAHADDLVTTYTSLADIYVAEGQVVGAGQTIGVAGSAHPGEAGVHFGVLLEGSYVDPESYLVAMDVDDAIRLMPVGYDLPEIAGRRIDIRALTGRTPEDCSRRRAMWVAPRPPNDNIVVAVAGIESSSGDPILTETPRRLGYDPADIFRFSYKGAAGLDLHTAYSRADTRDDIAGAAGELAGMLAEIARRFPGREVDMIAHSQGGIVARTFLEVIAPTSDLVLPQVEHLVTFSSPHRGAPGAMVLNAADGLLGGALGQAADLGLAIPKPSTPAVAQLEPGSNLMDLLGAAPPAFGTRYLSVGIPNDMVVTADRAQRSDAPAATVSPEGLSGHSAVVTSRQARALAYDALRDAPQPCSGAWDVAGPLLGRLISGAQWLVGGALEAISNPLPPLGRAADAVGR